MQIPKDKLLHVAFGAAAVVMTALIMWLGRIDFGLALAISATGVGVGNEYQQRLRNSGVFDWLDAAATAAPGWLAWAAIGLLQ